MWILERGGFSHQQLLLLITEREKRYILEKKQFLKRGFHSAFQKEAVSLEALGYPSFNFHQKHAQTLDPTHPAAIAVFPTEEEKQKTLRAGVSWVVP